MFTLSFMTLSLLLKTTLGTPCIKSTPKIGCIAFHNLSNSLLVMRLLACKGNLMNYELIPNLHDMLYY